MGDGLATWVNRPSDAEHIEHGKAAMKAGDAADRASKKATKSGASADHRKATEMHEAAAEKARTALASAPEARRAMWQSAVEKHTSKASGHGRDAESIVSHGEEPAPPKEKKPPRERAAKGEINLGEHAQSAIDVDVIEGRDDDADPASYATLREHYADGKIKLPDTVEKSQALHVALTDLANAHDEQAEHGHDKVFARGAAKELSKAADKVASHTEQLRDERGRFAAKG
jgi:hypothetical protein